MALVSKPFSNLHLNVKMSTECETLVSPRLTMSEISALCSMSPSSASRRLELFSKAAIIKVLRKSKSKKINIHRK